MTTDEQLMELLKLEVIPTEFGIVYELNGVSHRDHGPAVVYHDTSEEWYQHGVLHRDGGPSCTYVNTCQEWHQRGKLHRTDGPAIIWAPVGTPDRFGLSHSADSKCGSVEWYAHGELHRDKGPAIIRANGSCDWYRHGQLHRIDGPAVTRPNLEGVWYRSNIKINPPGWYAKKITAING